MAAISAYPIILGFKHYDPYIGILFVGAALVFWVLFFAGILFLMYYRIRKKEKTDVPNDSNPNKDRLADVVKRENHSEQNHMAGVYVMKPGILRRFALKVVLWAIIQLAKTFRPGFLGQLVVSMA